MRACDQMNQTGQQQTNDSGVQQGAANAAAAGAAGTGAQAPVQIPGIFLPFPQMQPMLVHVPTGNSQGFQLFQQMQPGMGGIQGGIGLSGMYGLQGGLPLGVGAAGANPLQLAALQQLGVLQLQAQLQAAQAQVQQSQLAQAQAQAMVAGQQQGGRAGGTVSPVLGTGPAGPGGPMQVLGGGKGDSLEDFRLRAMSLVPDRNDSVTSGTSGFSGPPSFSGALTAGFSNMDLRPGLGMGHMGPVSAPAVTGARDAAAAQRMTVGRPSAAAAVPASNNAQRRKAKVQQESLMRQVLKSLRSLLMYSGTEQRTRNEDLYASVSTRFNNISVPRFRKYFGVVEKVIRDAWGGSFEYAEGNSGEDILGKIVTDFIAFMCRPNPGESAQDAAHREMFERMRQQEEREKGSTLGTFIRRQGGSERRSWIYAIQNPECRVLYNAMMAPDGVANKVLAQWRILEKEKDFSAPASVLVPGAARGSEGDAGGAAAAATAAAGAGAGEAGLGPSAAGLVRCSPSGAMSDSYTGFRSPQRDRPSKKARPMGEAIPDDEDAELEDAPGVSAAAAAAGGTPLRGGGAGGAPGRGFVKWTPTASGSGTPTPLDALAEVAGERDASMEAGGEAEVEGTPGDEGEMAG